MKRSLLMLALLPFAALVCNAQDYWNNDTQLQPFRFPMFPSDARIEALDLNGDGTQDGIKSVIHGDIPVLWLDDDGNMRNGDTEGDFVNDCILVDRNRDGKYDFIVKHVDLNDDGVADMQIILDYIHPHYMVVIDEDGDGVFNYVDWNTVTLQCWEKNGLSDFYTDYSGNTMFLKAHRITNDLVDLRYNWENPFIFYDYDGDGLSEIALRFCDQPYVDRQAKSLGFPKKQYLGRMGWFSIGIDLDNDNCPGNDFDFDLTLRYGADNAFEYHECVHPLKNMRGLKEADKFFPDPRIRELTELIYPDRNQAWKKAYGGKWKYAYLTYDEDDDCGRWERVELYEDRDAFKLGKKMGGVDNHNQADPAGDRGEWDNDFSGGGDIYVGAFDGRIHLYGAERGVWRIDQNTEYYQGWDRRFQKTEPEKFATVEYLDTDGNGWFDTVNLDLDGDCSYEETISLSALGLDDSCKVLDVSAMQYRDYTKLFKKVAENMWKNAQSARRVAAKYGVSTFWYGKMMNPLDLREKYHDGWWLQFYIYKDIEYKIKSDIARGITPQSDGEAQITRLRKAYFSGNWKELM